MVQPTDLPRVLPPEINMNIIERLPIKQLFDMARGLDAPNKDFRSLARLALFSRRGKEARAYQESLLKLWVKGQGSAPSITTQRDQLAWGRLFKVALRDPNSSHEYQILCSLFIKKTLIPELGNTTDKIRHSILMTIPFSLGNSAIFFNDKERNQYLFDGFISNLSYANPNTHTNASQKLRKLASYTTDAARITKLFDILILQLNHTNKNVRNETYDTLCAFAPHFNATEIAQVFGTLIPELNNTHDDSQYKALNLLDAFAPHFNPTQIKELFDAFISKSSSINKWARWVAFRTLEKLAKHLTDDEQIACLFDMLTPLSFISQLKSMDYRLPTFAIRTLCALVPKVDSTKKNVLFDNYFTTLTSTHPLLSREQLLTQQIALEAISAWAPHLDAPQITKLGDALMLLLKTRHVNDNESRFPQAALQIVSELAPRLDKSHITSLVNIVRSYRNDENRSVALVAGETLCALAPHLTDRDQIATLFELFMPLQQNDWDSQSIAQQILCALALRLDYSHSVEILYLYDSLKHQLLHDNPSVQNVALKTLRALAPRLETGGICQNSLSVFDDEDERIRKYAVRLVEGLLPTVSKMEPELMPIAIDAILSKLDDKAHDIRQAAVSIITEFMPILSDTQLKNLVNIADKPNLEILTLRLIADAQLRLSGMLITLNATLTEKLSCVAYKVPQSDGASSQKDKPESPKPE